jgi:NAD-dependent deacetylase
VDDLERAALLLADRTRILVFTGAGISTESGIPDFRGPQGLWRKVDPADFTLRHWVTDGDFRTAAWSRRFGNERDGYAPNAAHRAVVTLWETGRMVGCVTQNIDGLHQMAGLPPQAVAELHGNAQGIVCYERRHPADPDQVATRWAAGESDPRCAFCGSILKSTTVLFGEQLPVAAVSRAQQWADDADAVLVIGSTLGVYPAADYPLQVAARGEPFVIVNQGPTDHDGLATLRVDGMAGAVVPALVAALAG